jgi:hypothetical protein
MTFTDLVETIRRLQKDGHVTFAPLARSRALRDFQLELDEGGGWSAVAGRVHSTIETGKVSACREPDRAKFEDSNTVVFVALGHDMQGLPHAFIVSFFSLLSK